MTRIVEPTRWLDARSDAPAEVRRLLADAHDALDPTPEELARLGAFIAGAGVVGAAASAGKVAALRAGSQALKMAGALKIATVIAVGGAVGGVGWSVLRDVGAPPPVVPVQMSNGGVRSTANPPDEHEIAPPSVDALPLPAAPDPAPVASVTRAPTMAPPTPHARGPASVAEPVVALDAEGGAAASHAIADGSELALVHRARSRMAADPTDALRALDEHRVRYPQGTFAQEREVLAIEALVHLGRRHEAEARAAAFANEFPRSAHLRRIAVLLGEDGGG